MHSSVHEGETYRASLMQSILDTEPEHGPARHASIPQIERHSITCINVPLQGNHHDGKSKDESARKAHHDGVMLSHRHSMEIKQSTHGQQMKKELLSTTPDAKHLRVN